MAAHGSYAVYGSEITTISPPQMMCVAPAEDESCPYDTFCCGGKNCSCRDAAAAPPLVRAASNWSRRMLPPSKTSMRERKAGVHVKLSSSTSKTTMREKKDGVNVKLMYWKRTGTYDENLLWCIYCPTTFYCGSKYDEDFMLLWFQTPVRWILFNTLWVE